MEDKEKNVEDREENLTFDEILKDKEYQAEFDRRIAKSLETAKSNWEKEYSSKKEEEKKEAERLAKLSAEEKLVERENKLKAREQEQNKKELVYQTKELLQKENLPLSFAEVMVGTNATAEEIKARINELKTRFSEELEIRMKQILAGNPPKKETKEIKNTISSQF